MFYCDIEEYILQEDDTLGQVSLILNFFTDYRTNVRIILTNLNLSTSEFDVTRCSSIELNSSFGAKTAKFSTNENRKRRRLESPAILSGSETSV